MEVRTDSQSVRKLRLYTVRTHFYIVTYQSILKSISRYCLVNRFYIHYITLSAFQTPPTLKVTSGGASTITCYTKYSLGIYTYYIISLNNFFSNHVIICWNSPFPPLVSPTNTTLYGSVKAVFLTYKYIKSAVGGWSVDGDQM